MSTPAQDRTGPPPGAPRVLAGRYRLLDQVAVGAMGEVWRAHDDRLDRDVAVKVLRPELADDAGFVERFRTEARHAASVRHPHVAAVHDYGEDEQVLTGGAATAYLVMDLLDGQTLGAVLEAGGPLPEDRVARLLAQVADALAAAHRTGLVHRDVKPANLVLCRPGADDGQAAPGAAPAADVLTGHEDVTVTDFGIARAADAVPVTRTGLVMGTAEYLSPEQARGARATAASDVYSLGVVAHELLTGTPPFVAPSPAEVARAHVQDAPPPLPATVSAAMRATVAACLTKDPDERPDAAALADRLRAVADGTAEDGWSVPGAAGDGRPRTDVPIDVPAPAPGPADLAAARPYPAAGTSTRDAAVTGAATREIPVVDPPRRTPPSPAAPARPATAARRTTTPAARRPARRRRWRLPVRAPVLALLALLALLLLATLLRQTGLLGGDDDGAAAAASGGPPPAAHVTGSPGTTDHEDGR